MSKVKHPKLINPIEKLFDYVTYFHIFLFGSLFLSSVLLTWHTLSSMFLSPPMDFYCDTTEILRSNISTDIVNHCPCSEPWWDTEVFSATMQTKYDVYCDTEWLVDFAQSVFSSGLLIGALMFGFLSDKYGRLSMFTMSGLVLAIFGSLVTVMPTASTYILMRCVEGIGAGGAVVTGYVLCVEYCGVRHRETITALYHIPINCGHASLAGLSYLLRDCDELQLAISLPTFLLVSLRWLLMESPKWMMDNNDIDGAAVIMEKFCRFNRNACENIKEELTQFHAQHKDKNATKSKFWTLFKYKRLTVNFACMAFIYFVCGMGYYGVSQFIGKMSGGIHMNVAISAALLLPGTVASVFLLRILGRRPFLMITNILSGIFIIIVIFIPVKIHWFRVLIASLSNTFFFMSFIIVFLYGVELFPTSIRNSVLGVLSVLSRIGQVAAPPVNSLQERVAGSIFGVLAIIGGILCYILPETKNTELPTSFEDTKTLPRKKILLQEDQYYDTETVGPSHSS